MMIWVCDREWPSHEEQRSHAVIAPKADDLDDYLEDITNGDACPYTHESPGEQPT